MSSNLAYLVYEAMTSGLSSVSFYAVDTSGNNHPFKVLVPSTNTYYYFDDSDAVYTATSFNISVNNNVILTIALNNVQKTANTTLIVVVTLSITINLPGNLGVLVTQAIQGLFAGVLLNLGCSATAYYVITNEQTNQQTQGSVNLSFSLVNDSEFTASGSISYSQYEVISITQIVISCSYANIQENILTSTLNSSECTNSSGCTFTVTVTFTS
jgi:hypothetical protein